MWSRKIVSEHLILHPACDPRRACLFATLGLHGAAVANELAGHRSLDVRLGAIALQVSGALKLGLPRLPYTHWVAEECLTLLLDWLAHRVIPFDKSFTCQRTVLGCQSHALCCECRP